MATLEPTPLQTGLTVYYMSRNLPKAGRIVGTITEHTNSTQTDSYLLEGEGQKLYVIGDSNFSSSNMIYENLDDLEEAIQNIN